MKNQLDLFSQPKHETPPPIPPKIDKPEIKSEIPYKILISSDDSELEFIRTIKGSELNIYKYTKGLEKVGTEVSWSKEYIQAQLKNYFRAI